jgi:heme A synthase
MAQTYSSPGAARGRDHDDAVTVLPGREAVPSARPEGSREAARPVAGAQEAQLRTPFQRLAAAAAAATFLLIAVGGLVRATGSGLGCPGWPLCYGRVVPPLEHHAIIEYSHRLVASVVIVLVGLLALAAWRSRQPRWLRWLTVAAIGLVLAQAALGAIVVWGKLKAEAVTLHLATSLALVAVLELVALRADRPARPRPAQAARPRGFARLAAGGATLTYAQMLVGSSVTGHDAGLAYPAGVALPGDFGLAAVQLQFGHRLLAMVVGATIVATWLVARRSRRGQPAVTRLAGAAVALVVVQIALGLANVADRLSAWTVVPHLATGSLIWGSMFALALQAGRVADDAERPPGGADAARRGDRQAVGT